MVTLGEHPDDAGGTLLQAFCFSRFGAWDTAPMAGSSARRSRTGVVTPRIYRRGSCARRSGGVEMRAISSITLLTAGVVSLLRAVPAAALDPAAGACLSDDHG